MLIRRIGGTTRRSIRPSRLSVARATSVALCILVAACGKGPRLELYEYAAIRMGTELRVLFYADEETSAAAAASVVFDRIARLDSLLSDYRSDGELALLARSAGGDAVPVSAELLAVMQRAVRLAHETDGAFDPTVGPVTAVWRAARRAGALPDSAALAEALRLIDWRSVEIDPVRATIRLAHPGMRLDLGGIAKGMAADDALRTLREHGHSRALVVFGGEIVAGDAPPGEAGWRVTSAILPDSQFRLAHRALSTSGDSEQFVIANGQRYSHVVDTRTGRGLTTGVSAAVLAADGITADAFATVVTTLDSEAQTAFIAAHPEAAFHVVRR